MPIPKRLKNITSCIDQIEIEKNATLRYDSIASIKTGLDVLIEQKWLDINEHTLLLVRTGMKNILSSDKSKLPKISQLTLEVELDRAYAKQHLDLLPLYRRVSMTLGLHLENVLEQRYGAYGIYERYDGKKNGRHYMRIALLLPRDAATNLKLEDIASLVIQATFEMYQKNGLNRTADQMARLSYKTDLIVPDIWETARTTGQILSAEEWHKLSTHKNVQNMLNEMHFRIKIGNKKGDYSLNSK